MTSLRTYDFNKMTYEEGIKLVKFAADIGVGPLTKESAGLLDQAKRYLAEHPNVRNSLIGGTIGAGVGGLSTLAQDEETRTPWFNVLTGAGVGAAGGAAFNPMVNSLKTLAAGVAHPGGGGGNEIAGSGLSTKEYAPNEQPSVVGTAKQMLKDTYSAVGVPGYERTRTGALAGTATGGLLGFGARLRQMLRAKFGGKLTMPFVDWVTNDPKALRALAYGETAALSETEKRMLQQFLVAMETEGVGGRAMYKMLNAIRSLSTPELLSAVGPEATAAVNGIGSTAAMTRQRVADALVRGGAKGPLRSLLRAGGRGAAALGLLGAAGGLGIDLYKNRRSMYHGGL